MSFLYPSCHRVSRKIKAVDVNGWYTIPKDEILRKKWISAIPREPEYPADDKDFVLCGLHFEEECFLRDYMSELTRAPRKWADKEDAIPSIFLFSKPTGKRKSSEMQEAQRTKKELVSSLEPQPQVDEQESRASKVNHQGKMLKKLKMNFCPNPSTTLRMS